MRVISRYYKYVTGVAPVSQRGKLLVSLGPAYSGPRLWEESCYWR